MSEIQLSYTLLVMCAGGIAAMFAAAPLAARQVLVPYAPSAVPHAHAHALSGDILTIFRSLPPAPGSALARRWTSFLSCWRQTTR